MVRNEIEAKLDAYRTRRDFARTPEPHTSTAGATGGRSFVVQKHAARRLHFDLRLELNGVLVSWAVTRGPSLDPADKRLAVRTEDHPLNYREFEGVIPKGSYGAGAVIVWDSGHWEPIGDAENSLRRGDLKFQLHGMRLKGAWALVRMKPRNAERRENWLLIKKRDQEATQNFEPTARWKTSVSSGRTIEAIGQGEPVATAARDLPSFVSPQLATP